MNYRHAFHAGNHGDVLKHAILSRVLTYYKQKASPFAVLDAHAAIGVYDLTGVEAFKTGEWKGGIGALLADAPSPELSGLLQPYLDVVRALNPEKALLRYPGSPELIRQLLRAEDRAYLNELHPEDYGILQARYRQCSNIRLMQFDALQAIKATLPFAERRGLLLIDPPFEVLDETQRVAKAVENALQRMANVCILVWYPVTTQEFADALCAQLPLAGVSNALRLELRVRAAGPGRGLAGSGLVAINPPWTLHREAETLLPYFARVLGEEGQGHFATSWLKGPA